jgi:adenylyltransferase/sulfurtransferase
MDAPPAPGTAPTCETAGILGPTVQTIAGFQTAEALKILLGRVDLVRPGLLAVDVWDNTIRSLSLASLRDRVDCPVCVRGDYTWLNAVASDAGTTRFCGRNAIQVMPAAPLRTALEEVAQRLSPLGRVSLNRFLLRFEGDAASFTLFPDGRAIIQGVDDPAKARSLYSRFIGG